MMFTIFDIVIFVIIGVSTVFGLYKGLINIFINLLGFVASIIAAIFLFPYVKFVFIGIIENELLISVISAIVSYICSLFVFTLITSRVSKLLNGISHGFLDRSLGLVFGFLRGLIIAIVLFVTVAVFASGSYMKAEDADRLITDIDTKNYPTWLSDSKSTSYLEGLLKRTILLLPENTLKSIKLPKTENKENMEIIDSIKKTKSKDSTSISVE